MQLVAFRILLAYARCMKSKQVLKSVNLKATWLRQLMLDTIYELPGLFFANDLYKLLQSHKSKFNKSSFYRNLDQFCEKAILQKVVLAYDKIAYELVDSHHHHFSCNNCTTVLCILDQELESKVLRIQDGLRDSGVVVQDHIFALNGLCSECK